MPVVATFSIVARDPRNGDLGVAVQSKFLAVGAVVPWAQAGAGAVATQALANIRFGPDGLALMAAGRSASETLAELLAGDPDAEQRQVGLVDAAGRAAAHTGASCMHWAGHRVGEGYAVQGNILAGARVVEAMATTFEQAEGELAERMLAALAAGQAAGGDRRGRQSAALYVARAGGAYGGNHDRYVDLRVDDHPEPIGELARLIGLHRFYLTPPDLATLVPITPAIASELQTMLAEAGYYSGPADGQFEALTRSALESYGGVENLEVRLASLDHDLIDPQVLAFMRRKR
ncbi:DUF1028 domain-containing protein [Oscillochloris sp. ZM17-4]|uniref:DUF1028 domain-containing protein n=1 Tax=Oscillochloris sp. ZM17-4 TaxID=2866714 RepID=UPI001C72B415|nr:DUF1028 domain-containing protein [Oscillochloris sp. ZM17-4]MBX0330861.1 DUF1028 domain-containing protein [Oscillochloris sp. ZM17-4]